MTIIEYGMLLPILFALLCLVARRNLFCLFIGGMVWLQTSVVVSAYRGGMGATNRNEAAVVGLLAVILATLAVLRLIQRRDKSSPR